MLLFSLSTFAQQVQKRWTAPSLDATTGLFKTWDADTLGQGETNLTVGYDLLHRDPGQLTIGRAPAGIAGAITDRFEIFGAMDVQKHIVAENIKLYRRPMDQLYYLPQPAATPLGATYFTQAAPFIDVPEATGRGDLHVGLKFNVLSEKRSDPFSFGVAAFGTIPLQRNAVGLSKGLSPGDYQMGFAFLMSKTVGDYVRLHMNYGVNFTTAPRLSNVTLADYSNEFFYKGGIELPVYRAVRVISEVNGIKYFGTKSLVLNPGNPLSTPAIPVIMQLGLNPTSPIDLIFGMRVYPSEQFSLGGGYQLSLRHLSEKAGKTPAGIIPAAYNGFVAQGTFATRRNDPPTVECKVDKQSIIVGETAKVFADGKDPDHDFLTYTWTSTGGKITPKDQTVTFDSTGVNPGKYTVAATVKDKKHSVGCSSDITVNKKPNRPPTARVEPSTFSIVQGESQNLRCTGADPDGDTLTYSWTVNGQRLAEARQQITFGSEGRDPGNYTVVCTVSDASLSATASSTGRVTAKPKVEPKIEPKEEPPVNKPPTIECQTTTKDVASGSSIELSARGYDPEGERLTYTWSTTGGRVTGRGNTATFDAKDVKAGIYTVSVSVSDGKLSSAPCRMTIYVSEKLSVTKDKCGYFLSEKSRVDNCAKAILDDLAVRMKNESKLQANIIGYTDNTEKVKKLGESRAKNVSAYLQKRGVEASRLTVTDGGAKNSVGDNKTVAGRKLNRRVEIELTAK